MTDKDLYDTIGTEQKTKLHEMVALGKNYREDMEIDVFGGTVKIEHRALPDKEFLPLLSDLAETLDMEMDVSSEEVIDEATEEIEEARDEEGNIDITQLDDQFVDIAQEAAARGITAAYDEDGEKRALEKEETEGLLADMVGGLSVEIGMVVLDTAGGVRDAELFR